MALSPRKKRVQLVFDREDHDYLKKLSQLTGTTVSAMVRDIVREFCDYMRQVFGDLNKLDESQAEVYLRNFMRITFVRLANAFSEMEQAFRLGDRGEAEK